jgi:hypothetical protein
MKSKKSILTPVENMYLAEALTFWAQDFEARIKEEERQGRRSIFASNYGHLVARDILLKIK